MKKIRVGINGFGRIGRITTRLLAKDPNFELVAINDLTPPEQNVHLLKYDSVHGVWDKNPTFENGNLKFEGHSVKIFSQRDPVEIPWKDLNVDVVIESTGIFTNYDGASKHLKGGAKRVLVSAP